MGGIDHISPQSPNTHMLPPLMNDMHPCIAGHRSSASRRSTCTDYMVFVSDIITVSNVFIMLFFQNSIRLIMSQKANLRELFGLSDDDVKKMISDATFAFLAADQKKTIIKR